MLSIRTRLLVLFTVVVIGGFALITHHLLKQVRPYYLQAMEETLVDVSTVLAGLVSAQSTAEQIDTSVLDEAMREANARRFHAEIYQLVKEQHNLRIYATDTEGVVLYDSADELVGQNLYAWHDVLKTLRGTYGARSTRAVEDDPRTSTLFIASPILHDGEIIGVLTVAKPVDSVTFFLEVARSNVIMVSAFGALLILLMAVLLTSRITQPIADLRRYATAIGDGQRPTMPNLGRNEIADLGKAFEEMRDALEGKQYAERYVQTLTHEMKSPLAAIRGAAELLQEADLPQTERERFAANITHEAERLHTAIDRLLQLSSIESRKALDARESVDVTAMLEALIDDLPERNGRQISIQSASESSLDGDLFLLRQMFLNVLQNAIDFTGSEGLIEIDVAVREGAVVITVADDGCGLPEYAVDRAFEHFYSLPRPETGRKSTGLGLSMVREIVQLHGGTIALANRPEGGAIVTITLPVQSG